MGEWLTTVLNSRTKSPRTVRERTKANTDKPIIRLVHTKDNTVFKTTKENRQVGPLPPHEKQRIHSI